MFAKFACRRKVSRGLLELGWSPEALPSSHYWPWLIAMLCDKGVKADEAASLLDRALLGDEDAIQEVNERSNGFGERIFGTSNP